MRKIALLSWEELPRRVESIKRSLENIYGVELSVEFEEVPLDRLHPTESFLENDKLALVLVKVVTEGYNVPIIAVKHEEAYFILDGHHRSFILRKLVKKTIGAHVLNFPRGKSYRTQLKLPLENLPIKAVAAVDDPILSAWGHTLILLKYYEALYSVSFSLRKEHVPLRGLVPTQAQTRKRQIDSIKELTVPIVCIKHQSKFYILDGHSRSIRAKQLRLKSIPAIVLSPEAEIDYGIVKTARKMNLKSIEDIKIVEF